MYGGCSVSWAASRQCSLIAVPRSKRVLPYIEHSGSRLCHRGVNLPQEGQRRTCLPVQSSRVSLAQEDFPCRLVVGSGEANFFLGGHASAGSRCRQRSAESVGEACQCAVEDRITLRLCKHQTLRPATGL